MTRRAEAPGILGTALVAALLVAGPGPARAREPGPPARPGGIGARSPPVRAVATRETGRSWHDRHAAYFRRNWGIDVVGVRRVSSGFMLRFDYRVVNPARAAALTDRQARPYLIDQATGTALAVPAMENVGELRQVAQLQPNRTYFMIFGNPGGLVKHGSRVTLVVGNFRAEGLVVD